MKAYQKHRDRKRMERVQKAIAKRARAEEKSRRRPRGRAPENGESQ